MKKLFWAVMVVTLAAGAVLCLAPGSVKGQTASGGAAQQEAAAQYQQQLNDYQTRMKRSDDLMKSQEEAQRRAAALMTKQEANNARFDKILETWEKQQKQYQKYLDGLAK